MNRSLNFDSNSPTVSKNGYLDSSKMSSNQNISGFTHKAPLLSTDMRCYFGCNQGFKKDWDLRMHLKLKHKNENEFELERAYQDAEDEIALTRRSLSIFQCVLCPKQYTGMGPFFGHIKKAHDMKWLDYKFKYGSCELEQGPFQCQICERVMKYDRNNVDRHLKSVHSITWPMYIERIRKLRRGEMPDELPTIQLFSCHICNASIKDLFEHVKRVHNINELEYAGLAKDRLVNSSTNPMAPEVCGNFANVPVIVTTRGSISQYDETTNSTLHSPKHDLLQQNYPIKTEMNVQPSRLEIKDKTNKRCSPCDEEFDSRRFFIEHCSSVHNMKFKTASGAHVISPTLYNQSPNQKFSSVPVVKQEMYSPSKSKFFNHLSPHSPTFSVHMYQKRSRAKEDFGPEESMNIGTESRYGRKIKRTSL